MSTDSELLIKIRTALESGGLDQAKQKLAELTGGTIKGTVETAKHGMELEKLTTKANGLSKVFQGLKGVLSGDALQAFNGLNKVVVGLRTLLGTLSSSIIGIGAAFAGGWTAGSAIFKKFVTDIKSAEPAARSTREDLEKMAKVSLAQLSKEFGEIKDSVVDIESKLTATITAIDKQAGNVKSIDAADIEMEIAAANRMPEGPKKKKTLAALENKRALTAAKDEYKYEGEKVEALTLSKQKLETKISEAEATVEKLRKLYSEGISDRDSLLSKSPERRGMISAPNMREARRKADIAEDIIKPELKSTEKELADMKAFLPQVIQDRSDSQIKMDIAGKKQITAGFTYDAAMANISKEQSKQITDDERKLRLDKIEQEFKKEKNPARLKEMMIQKTALQFEMLPDEMANDVRIQRGHLIRNENADTWKNRLKELAIEREENVLKTEEKKRHSSGIIQAKKLLERVNKDDERAINEILGIAQSLYGSNQQLFQRIQQLRSKEKITGSQIRNMDRSGGG